MVLRFCPCCGKECLAPLNVADYYGCDDCGKMWLFLDVTEIGRRHSLARAPLYRIATDQELAAEIAAANCDKEVSHG